MVSLVEGSGANSLGAATERTRRYYDAFAPTYEARRDGRSRYHDLVDALEAGLALPYVRGRDVLEVGCGTGLVLRRLATVARRCVGVDLSPRMLDVARARGLEVVEGNALDLPFERASFDVVVSFKTLPHVPDLRRALAEMARVVRHGGIVIAGLYNPWSMRAAVKRVLPPGRVGLGTERDVDSRFDGRAALERALPSGWRVVRVRGARTFVPAARALDLPWVGEALERLERAVADTPVAARLGGFVSYVLARDG